MKKFTLIASLAAVALSAQAQYQVNPTTKDVVSAKPEMVKYIILSEGAIADFEKAGAKVTYIGPSPDEGRNLWYWNGLDASDDSAPRVDNEDGGYTAVEVTGAGGWSGAGFAVDNPGINTADFNDATHFHLAYMAPTGTAPVSTALILIDGKDVNTTGPDGQPLVSAPAKVALGNAFNDNGAIYPTIGETPSDEWKGIDITLGQLKRIYPAFDYRATTNWQGNIMSFLGGGRAGDSVAFDAVYFYNPEGAGVNDIVADSDFDFVVTDNTVNVAGTTGIQLYNMAGQLVKSTNGTTLGLNDLQNGLYIAKAGNKTKKVIVK